MDLAAGAVRARQQRPAVEPHLELWRQKKTGKLLAVRWEGGRITGAVRRKRRADGDLPVVTPALFEQSRPYLVILAEEEQAEHEVVWSLMQTLEDVRKGWKLLADGLEGNTKRLTALKSVQGERPENQQTNEG